MPGGGDAADNRARYTLSMLLSTLGLPYQFASAPPDDPALTLTISQGETSAAHDLSLITHHSSLSTVFSLLAREEEYTIPDRDQHDRFLWSHSQLRQHEAGARPFVSDFCQKLLASLREECGRLGLPMVRKEPWPHGKTMAACLTHDVDVVRRGKLGRGVAVRDVKDVLSNLAHGRAGRAARQAAGIVRTALSHQDPYWTFDRISALEDEHRYRSTYFFMTGRLHPEDASYGLHDPGLARLLGDLRHRGREIALHGSYASYSDGQSLRRQRKQLETATGLTLSGHRNHLLRFRAPDSWKAQEAAGFSYDSTLGFADQEGFRGAHAFPFHPYDLASDRPLDLLEMPLALMEVTLYKYRRLRGPDASEAVRKLLHQVLSVNGLATLLWHNDTFYEPEYPDSGRLFEETLSWLSIHDVHVAPCGEIDRWWRAREAVVLSPLPDGRTGWRMETPLEIDGLVLRAWLSDPALSPRVAPATQMRLRRDSADYLLEFGRLRAGSSLEIEWS